jgi:steroid delta-isomerase-like uncharacterized protein
MADDRVTLVHEWFEQVWNRGDVAAIDRLLAPDSVVHGLKDADGNEVQGKQGFVPFFHRFRDAFPDMQIVVEDAIVEGDKIACRCTVRGTHRGHTLGFAATLKPVEFTGMCFIRVRNGQIVEGWNNFDFATMTAQLQAV